jgi:aryl-alcohol dehydrogenase-like predicted oxidoreductase
MISRRDWLRLSLGSGAALALDPHLLGALQPQQILTRAIPSTGERLPVVGLGSSATFGQVARSADVGAVKEVMRTLVEQGGRVFDTAPVYGGSASEEVAGRVARELGITDKIFWATKVNVARAAAAPPTRRPRGRRSRRRSSASASARST